MRPLILDKPFCSDNWDLEWSIPILVLAVASWLYICSNAMSAQNISAVRVVVEVV